MAHQAAIGDPQEQGITDLPRSSSPAQLDDDEDADDAGDSRPALFRFRPRSSTYSTRKDIEANEATFDTTKTHHWQHPDEARASCCWTTATQYADRTCNVVLTVQSFTSSRMKRTAPRYPSTTFVSFSGGTALSFQSLQNPSQTLPRPSWRGSKAETPFCAQQRIHRCSYRACSTWVRSRISRRCSPLRVTVVVDQALEVVDRYHTQLTKLEASVLVKPRMTAVRSRMASSRNLPA